MFSSRCGLQPMQLLVLFVVFLPLLVTASFHDIDPLVPPTQNHTLSRWIDDVTKVNLNLSEATARSVTTFTASGPPSQLFGPIAVSPASAADLAPGVHPRIAFDATEWDAIINRYADPTHFNRIGSWSRHQRLYTLTKGPQSAFIASLAALDTSAYPGDTTDPSGWDASQREVLKPLADFVIANGNEFNSGSFFMCFLWAEVNARLSTADQFLPSTAEETCKNALVAWARALLAHRVYLCAGACSDPAVDRGHIWNTAILFGVSNDWYSAGMGMAMAYDVAYSKLDTTQQTTIRSAISMLVLNKASWGTTETSTRGSPNAEIHPHRIFSNWGPYHSNLYLTNLAIEGETGYDVYASAVLAAAGQTSGFNAGLKRRFEAMYSAYAIHSIYPDGATFEDGYTYFIALREGSLGFVAAQRRGINLMDTDRFRGLIHYLAQLMEPWHCGSVIGHASGGGVGYPAYASLFRYAYPQGPLPAMLWRQRMGSTVGNNAPCRIDWHQNMVQISILGADHDAGVTSAISPESLEPSPASFFPRSFFSPRRGLLVARNTLSESSAVAHFDARPDAFFPGHDNADRGVVTFTALRRSWFADLPDWRNNVDSRKHTLLHIDGLAQDEKAPSVSMFRTDDDSEVVTAAADLTYAYNVQWARNWPDQNEPTRHVVVYNPDETFVNVRYTEKEVGDPRSFGWPAGDDGADLGMTRSESNLWGDPDMGFLGMYTWKRDYRTSALTWMVRSMALVRSATKTGYLLFADSVSAPAGSHVYEEYIALSDGVSVDSASSSCDTTSCVIALTDGTSSSADVHIVASASTTTLSFREESFTTETTHRRLVVRVDAAETQTIWVGVHAHVNDRTGFTMGLDAGDPEVLRVMYGADEKLFRIDASDHGLVRTTITAPPTTVPPTTMPPTTQPTTMLPTTLPPITLPPPTLPPPGTPPMSPLVLPSRSIQVFSSQLSDNPAEFLDTQTTYPLQVVIRMMTSRGTTRRPDHRLRTCRWTRGTTEIAIYDCGDALLAATNYASRNCQLVYRSNALTDSCGGRRSERTDMIRPLTGLHTYFIAVSIEPQAARSPRVELRYSTARWPLLS